MPDQLPAVLLQVWGVERAKVPSAMLRMASTRRLLRQAPGLRFRKLLGTGSGRSFTVRDADPRHWALLTVWDDDAPAARFLDGHPALDSWAAVSRERLDVHLRPLASRGRWSGTEPFGNPLPGKTFGPVAAITRARIRPRKALTFWRAVPPVSLDLRQTPGLQLAIGIGEAPVGLQGTFSLWDDAQSLNDFAHRRRPHVEAIRRTEQERWYVEELFARFAVTTVRGSYHGRSFEIDRGARPDADRPSP
ncbi:monooxygenase [Angustibacter sp. McL0619]|uniref:monooxygenase n=1 Tax=Angustibacter sp. McL0619 TaxID=3415676 RepID=UPI003CEF1094